MAGTDQESGETKDGSKAVSSCPLSGRSWCLHYMAVMHSLLVQIHVLVVSSNLLFRTMRGIACMTSEMPEVTHKVYFDIGESCGIWARHHHTHFRCANLTTNLCSQPLNKYRN